MEDDSDAEDSSESTVRPHRYAPVRRQRSVDLLKAQVTRAWMTVWPSAPQVQW